METLITKLKKLNVEYTIEKNKLVVKENGLSMEENVCEMSW